MAFILRNDFSEVERKWVNLRKNSKFSYLQINLTHKIQQTRKGLGVIIQQLILMCGMKKEMETYPAYISKYNSIREKQLKFQ